MSSFRRARNDEQREERRRAILATAAAMLEEMPVSAISMNELSRRVGLAKSNVMRYFESRSGRDRRDPALLAVPAVRRLPWSPLDGPGSSRHPVLQAQNHRIERGGRTGAATEDDAIVRSRPIAPPPTRASMGGPRGDGPRRPIGRPWKEERKASTC